jgi:two-component system, sensor histidine kinase and response regulator
MEKLKILIVEDDRTTQKLYERFLFEEIFDRTFAKTGGEALELFHTVQPDVILLDLMLPEVSGYNVLKQIREDYQDKQIPIIISTSLISKEDIVSCAKFGIQGYLTKPIIWKEVSRRILETLQKSCPQMTDRINELKNLLDSKGEPKDKPKDEPKDEPKTESGEPAA